MSRALFSTFGSILRALRLRETAEYKKVHRKLLYETYANVKGITGIRVAKREFSE